MVLHQLSGDMEITFQIRFCAYRIIISVETLVKTATHRRCGKVLTNIQTEMDKSSSTKQAISEYRNSDFQISGSVISSHKNIHFSNNLSENVIRPFTIGRKNWLFSVSPRGATVSSIVYTMIEMAKANNLNTYKYLTYLLSKLKQSKMIADIIWCKRNFCVAQQYFAFTLYVLLISFIIANTSIIRKI